MLHKFRNKVKKKNTNDKKVIVTIEGLEGIGHLKMKILLNSVYICIMNNISNVFFLSRWGAKQHWTTLYNLKLHNSTVIWFNSILKHIFCNILKVHGAILITFELVCTLKCSFPRLQIWQNLLDLSHFQSIVCSIMIQTKGNFIRPLPFRLTQLAASSDERKIFKERL